MKVYLETRKPVGNDSFPSGRKRDILNAIDEHEEELFEKWDKLKSRMGTQ